MKCGRELALGQVFCKECQADMANYPVKPGTPVALPQAPVVNLNRRSTSRKPRKPEEQLSRLRRVMISLLVLFMIVIAAGTMLVYSLTEKIDTLEQTIASISEEME
jgi:membrane glycosyltransferase